MPVLSEDGQMRAEWTIPSGVFVVTLRSGERVNAYAAGWVVRVSEVPVIIQVAVWEKNFSYELAKDCDVFVVQVLGEGQQAIARHFGRTSGRELDKLEGYDVEPGESGIPILTDCLSFLECEVVSRQTFGDHIVLVGCAINSHVNRDTAALIYSYEEYQ